jgi:hypothetical protein
VESAIIPIVSPKNERATLGSVIVDIRNKPDKFTVRLQPKPPLDGVIAFTDTLALLWTAQLDRHGTADESQPLTVSLQEAQDAVVLAAQLVHWLQNGGFAAKG